MLAYNSGTANGTPVEVVACASATPAVERQRVTAGYSLLTRLNKCLDVATNHTKIQIWTCNGTPMQS
ncbi:RICIN domain-containing protein [Streptomyces clavuligerus]|uniref:RICIN domain-containing protein n=1 Tax=Streptomyces clavuligerus TaxID=1901 RepID=UPI001E4EB003|nr:RICIN domain-containing protein [Streptomyces clavuligerus]